MTMALFNQILNRLIGGTKVIRDHRVIAVGVRVTIHQNDGRSTFAGNRRNGFIYKGSDHKQSVNHLVIQQCRYFERTVVLVYGNRCKEKVDSISTTNIFNAENHL